MQTLYFSTNYTRARGDALGEDTYVHVYMLAFVQGVHIWNDATLFKVDMKLVMIVLSFPLEQDEATTQRERKWNKMEKVKLYKQIPQFVSTTWTLFKSGIMLCGIDIIPHDIPHFAIRNMENIQSYKTMLWIWIMLRTTSHSYLIS